MPKFTELEHIDYSVKQKLTENAKEEFTDLLSGLLDYISDEGHEPFYGERVESSDQLIKIYNTIDDLQAKFADYEFEADDSEKAQVSEYSKKVDQVIDALKAFAASGEEKEPKSDDYADKVDEAFNKDPENALEQAGLVKEGE